MEKEKKKEEREEVTNRSYEKKKRENEEEDEKTVFNPKEQGRRKRSAVPLESSNGVPNPLKWEGKSEMETISREKPARRTRLRG